MARFNAWQAIAADIALGLERHIDRHAAVMAMLLERHTEAAIATLTTMELVSHLMRSLLRERRFSGESHEQFKALSVQAPQRACTPRGNPS